MKQPRWGWVSIQDFITWVLGALVVIAGVHRNPSELPIVMAGLAIMGVPFVRQKGKDPPHG